MDKARQKMQETHQDRETRSAGSFPSFESQLPTLVSRLNFPVVDAVTSYLGLHNPFSHTVEPETEAVWLLDNTAYRPVHVYPHKPQPWQAEFVVAYFLRNSGRDISKVVADIADKIGLDQEGDAKVKEDGESRIRERIQPFLDSIRPARMVDVKFLSGDVTRLGPGGRNGISSQLVTVKGEHKDGVKAEVTAIPEEVSTHGSMIVDFAEPEGWAVISDIDDSIKVTMTPSPIGILRTTFVDTPKPITGMPDLYQHIHSTIRPTWFYLSASPYNLYPFLRTFLREFYPQGTTILRDASWMDLAGFLASLTQGTQAYKVDRMDKVHSWLPKRKFLCVGDSTQTDPEAYGEIYRKYPHWIHAIFIRKVTDVAELNETDKNDDSRFEKAFKDVPRNIWRTFTDPRELYEAVDALVKE
ncbi:MAG: hypothetical protein M1830_008511 [Pleopsidium flavum]|nr:MAG: hypothetical protein M1830_008511 [Pleopsidium flavum]